MQTITTKYLAPTNSRGSRIKVTSNRGSKTYSYDYAASEPHKAAFDEYLAMINRDMAEHHPRLSRGGKASVVQAGSVGWPARPTWMCIYH